jgi:rhamnose utilization protein RhaD (predicted bifunctional aldolase and dehydrogenase)
VTPDHTIRTKNWPLIVPAPEAGKLDEWKTDVRGGGGRLRRALSRLFRRNNAQPPKKTELDPCRASFSCRARDCSGLARARRMRPSPPTSPRTPSK